MHTCVNSFCAPSINATNLILLQALFHRKYSSSSDVWSYGMTLFEVWSFGGRPFHALSVDQVRMNVQ